MKPLRGLDQAVLFRSSELSENCLVICQDIGRRVDEALGLPARSRSRLPKNLFGEQVGEGRAATF